MERTSLITRLLVANASDYTNLTLVNGLPNKLSQTTYFAECPLVLEGADLKETIDDNDQGQLLSIAVRARIARDSSFYLLHPHKQVILYLELVNGERYLLGTHLNSLLYTYSRDSGAGNADSRDTVLNYSQIVPL